MIARQVTRGRSRSTGAIRNAVGTVVKLRLTLTKGD